MDEDIPKYLYDALKACQHVQEFTRGVSFDAYKSDELLKSAVERKLEIVGEALNRIKQRDLDQFPCLSARFDSSERSGWQEVKGDWPITWP